jgi:hypothetical protein
MVDTLKVADFGFLGVGNRHCERSAAIQFYVRDSGLPRFRKAEVYPERLQGSRRARNDGE